MRSNRAPILLLVLSALATALALTVTRSDGRHATGRQSEAELDMYAAETARLRRHLAQVEAELRASDVSHLSDAQRDARALNLDRLRAYRLAGRFPHNHDRPGERPTIFVDEHGTLCAMAYLIAQSGRRDLVESVSRTHNHARIHELADDPELVAWLDSAGLTVDEAARVQPWYDHVPEEEDGGSSISRRYGVASAVLLGLSGAATLNNLLADRAEAAGARWSGILGLAAGVANMGLGIAKLDDDGGAQTLGIVNAGVGIASVTLGGVTLRRAARGPDTAGRRDAKLELLPATGLRGAGLQLRLRF